MPAHFRGQIPPKPQFCGREEAFSSQTGEIEKHAYYQNCCVDSNQILHIDKDHHMPLVGGPNMLITNPKWWTAAILEKSKNGRVSATV